MENSYRLKRKLKAKMLDPVTGIMGQILLSASSSKRWKTQCPSQGRIIVRISEHNHCKQNAVFYNFILTPHYQSDGLFLSGMMSLTQYRKNGTVLFSQEAVG